MMLETRKVSNHWRIQMRGGARDAPLGPISFILMQFLAKILEINKFSVQNQIATYLGNPGSATGNISNVHVSKTHSFDYSTVEIKYIHL